LRLASNRTGDSRPDCAHDQHHVGILDVDPAIGHRTG
jgi:hypothetical protein